MSQLFKNTRIHQIFGANTNVGKTVLATGIVRSALAEPSRGRVLYLKPVSTGPEAEDDQRFVQKHTAQYNDRLETRCLFRFNEPISPHLAALRSSAHDLPSDDTFATFTRDSIAEFAAKHDGGPTKWQALVETAGGVHSPSISGSSQADAYRPLLMPTILVGDHKLGGISTTLSSFESLHLRGFTTDAVILFRDSYYQNFEYLAQYFNRRNIPCFGFPEPPSRAEDRNEDFELMSRYYEDFEREGWGQALLETMDRSHETYIQELESMPQRAMGSFWWPFVQHKHVQSPSDVTVIDSAHRDFFNIYKSSEEAEPASNLVPQFDSSGSWWTQALGHGNAELTLSAAHAAGRYGHVIFPQAVHGPALRLAERLLHDGPGSGWASRVFFSDDGSTGMEVALKMALRATTKHYGIPPGEQRKRLGVLGFKGSYHGDTIGSMDACQEGIFTSEWHDAKGYWIDPPTVGIQNRRPMVSIPEDLQKYTGTSHVKFFSLQGIYNVKARLHSDLAHAYNEYLDKILDDLSVGTPNSTPNIGAVVLEPLVMGAGGMIFVDPLLQCLLVDKVRQRTRAEGSWQGLPVIFDEVFVGFYRLDMQSCAPLLGVNPDIAVYAKILTGGMAPMAVTLATDAIFQAFMGDSKADALLHGHSYTAYPIGCEFANKTLDIMKALVTSEEWKTAKSSWKTSTRPGDIWSFWHKEFAKEVSELEVVEETMALGTLFVIRFKESQGSGYASSSAREHLSKLASGSDPLGIHFRTLGNVAYFMGSLNTSENVYRTLEESIRKALT